MKQKFKLIFVLALLLISVENTVAQGLSIGAALKGSTMGVGGDIILGINPKMDVRVGFETMAYKRDFSFKEFDISYDAMADVKLGSISALFDYYFTKSFFATAGVGYNLFHTNVSGLAASGYPYGDIVIPKEKIGEFEFDINPSMKISPYLGLGFGRALGIEKNFSMAFEIGTYFQGSPDLSIVTTGLLSPTMNPEHGQEMLLEQQVSQFYLFPVVKLSFSYKILSFKK